MINYRELLQNPPQDAKGKTRWWWYGCCVTKEEIARQLTLMRDAYLGGVELQILYPLVPNDSAKGIKNIEYFSPEFFEILDFTAKKTNELGMTLDFTLASSWPFGGPFVPHSMAPQNVCLYQIDVTGPRKFSYDFTNRFAGKIILATLGKMENSQMIESSILDITEQINRKYLFSWPWGYSLEELDIPEGDWKMVVMVSNKYRQNVPAPAPNAEGYAIDHCRRDVSDFYFKNGALPIVEKIGRGKISNFFCDSIELEGNNWTEILLDEFKKRRGYSLEKYCYALWGDIESLTPYIRHDYFQTMSELTIENFFENFTAWCQENESKSRIQVHGTWGDILKAYGSADIPEGETFGSHDKLYVNTIHRRLASSAGSIYNKKIVSNESFTWLRMPRFLVTLEMMKAAVDAIFLDGINRIYNHGWSYSPEYAGEPGFAFYASSHICQTNTWWPFYANLGSYIQTVSAFMQLGPVYSEVAVYLPQSDIWSESPMGDLHLAMKIDERLDPDCINNLNRRGYYTHFLNDEAIQKLSMIGSHGITIQSCTYKTLILIACDTMPVETAKKIQEFVERGGNLILVDSSPHKNPGFINREILDRQVKIIFESISSVTAKDRFDGLLTCIKALQKPDVEIVDHYEEIGCIHRTQGADDIYFVSNISQSEKITTIRFKNTKNITSVLDPIRKVEKTIISKESDQAFTSVTLRLSAYDSVIFTFGLEEERVLLESLQVVKFTDITQNWTLDIEGKSYNQEKIQRWEILPEHQFYSKNAAYTKTVYITKEDISLKKIILELENLYHCANVYVNQQLAGQIWKRPNEIDILPYIREGSNEIVLEVFNLLINKVIDPVFIESEKKKWLYPENETLEEWPYHTEIINDIVKKRLLTTREAELIKEPRPSGIDGVVRLKLIS